MAAAGSEGDELELQYSGEAPAAVGEPEAEEGDDRRRHRSRWGGCCQAAVQLSECSFQPNGAERAQGNQHIPPAAMRAAAASLLFPTLLVAQCSLLACPNHPQGAQGEAAQEGQEGEEGKKGKEGEAAQARQKGGPQPWSQLAGTDCWRLLAAVVCAVPGACVFLPLLATPDPPAVRHLLIFLSCGTSCFNPQDKSPDREEKRGHRGSQPPAASEPAEAAAGEAAAEQRRAEKEERRKGKEQASGERDRRLGPRLFDRAVAAAVQDSGKRSSEEEETRHRSSKRSRK